MSASAAFPFFSAGTTSTFSSTSFAPFPSTTSSNSNSNTTKPSQFRSAFTDTAANANAANNTAGTFPSSFGSVSSSSSSSSSSSAGVSAALPFGSSSSSVWNPSAEPSNSDPFTFTTKNQPKATGATATTTSASTARGFLPAANTPVPASTTPFPFTSSSSGPKDSLRQSFFSQQTDGTPARPDDTADSSDTDSEQLLLDGLPRVAAKFGPSNNLFFFAGPLLDSLSFASNSSASAAGTALSLSSSSSASSSVPSSIFELDWFSDSCWLSSLYSSWHSIFVHLQSCAVQQKSELSDESWLLFLSGISRLYRASFEAALRNALDSLYNDEPFLIQLLKEKNWTKEEMEAQLLLFDKAKSVWHLFELVFIDPHENISRQLVDWLQRTIPPPHFSSRSNSDSTAAALTDDTTEDDSEDDLFYLMGRFLVQGRIYEVIDVLHANSAMFADSANAVDGFEQILNQLPALNPASSSLNIQSFLISFQSWKSSLDELVLSFPFFHHHPGFDHLISILRGEQNVLIEFCDSWMELFIANLLYIKPHAMKDELTHIMQMSIEQMKTKQRKDSEMKTEAETETQDSAIEVCYQTILSFALDDALNSAIQLFDLRIFAAHLVDLLSHAGQLQGVKLPNLGDVDLREYWLLEYAETLMSDAALFVLAVDYLSFCPRKGRAYLARLIETQLVDENDDERAYQLMDICKKYELPPYFSYAIAKQMAAAKLRCKRTLFDEGHDEQKKNDTHALSAAQSVDFSVVDSEVGNAVFWYCAAKDVAAIQHIAFQIVDVYATQLFTESVSTSTRKQKALFALRSVVENIDPHIQNHALSFVVDYTHFQNASLQLFAEKVKYEHEKTLKSLQRYHRAIQTVLQLCADLLCDYDCVDEYSAYLLAELQSLFLLADGLPHAPRSHFDKNSPHALLPIDSAQPKEWPPQIVVSTRAVNACLQRLQQVESYGSWPTALANAGLTSDTVSHILTKHFMYAVDAEQSR